MKKLSKFGLGLALTCILLSFTMFGCQSRIGIDNDGDGFGQWSVDWDKYKPVVGLPTPPQSDGEGDGDKDELPVQPQINYSYMIKSGASSLNIRSAPSTGGSVVGSMDRGDMLRYSGEKDGWYKTVYKQKTAYVYAGNNYANIVTMKQGGEKVEKIIAVGEELMGYPYVWGSQRYHWGNGKLNSNFVQGEFDCSALIQYIFYHGAGVLLELNTRTQVLQGTTVGDNDLRRGDVMFFTNADRYNKTGVERVGHVALYLGDNYILHTASDHAVIEEISPKRWSYFIVAKRFV